MLSMSTMRSTKKMNKQFKMIYVEITNRCNLDCPFCSRSRFPKEMTPEEFAPFKGEAFTNHCTCTSRGAFVTVSFRILEIAQKRVKNQLNDERDFWPSTKLF